jgi:hypothetical protein
MNYIYRSVIPLNLHYNPRPVRKSLTGLFEIDNNQQLSLTVPFILTPS